MYSTWGGFLDSQMAGTALKLTQVHYIIILLIIGINRISDLLPFNPLRYGWFLDRYFKVL